MTRELKFGIILAAALWVSAGCETTRRLGTEIWSSPDRKVASDYLLVAPSSASDEKAFGPQEVFLTDMKGRIAKQWTIKRTAGHSRLRADGTLVSLLLSTVGSRLTSNGGECNELIGTDSQGKEVFSLPMAGLSHDFDTFEDKIAVLKFDHLNRKQLREILPKTEMEFGYLDRLLVIDSTGKEFWSWSLKDHIKNLRTSKINEANTTLTNANSVQYIKKILRQKHLRF